MEPIIPNNILTVIIRDNSPMIFLQDAVSHRSVKIELTHEQVEQLKLNWIGTSCGHDYYEEIAQCFIEPNNPTAS